MASETDIANLAGILIGTESRITTLDDDRTLARTLRAIWSEERQATLRDGSFNFSMRRFALPEEVLAPGTVIYPFAHSFKLPAEALRLVEVLGDISRDAYQLEGRNVLCDQGGPLYVRCVVDVPEPAEWDAAFANAFAHRLAFKAGPRIAGSTFDERGAWSAYREALGSAKRVDAMENPPIEAEESSWVSSRWGGR